jgi:hypothetical protein
MQASHTEWGIDLVGVARACRFRNALAIEAQAEVDAARRLLRGKGPTFIQARVEAEDVARVLPIRDGHAIKTRFMEALSKAQLKSASL